MKKLILGTVIGGIVGSVLILVIITVFDNSRKKSQIGLQLVTNDSTKTNESKKPQSLVYGDYMNLDSTDFLLIPFGMKTEEDIENKVLKNRSSEEYGSENIITSGYRSYKYNFYSLDFGNCNNIIFYNKKTDETHLLLQKPAVISQFYFPYYNKEYTGKKYWFMLLGIHEEDTNKDGYINSEDGEKVYISDLTGKNMTQIAPDSTQLIDWYIDEKTNNILMKIRLDSNKDKKYNYNDDIEILKTSISAPTIGKVIINDEIKENIKKIMKQIK
jgi:hypothetical protein